MFWCFFDAPSASEHTHLGHTLHTDSRQVATNGTEVGEFAIAIRCSTCTEGILHRGDKCRFDTDTYSHTHTRALFSTVDTEQQIRIPAREAHHCRQPVEDRVTRCSRSHWSRQCHLAPCRSVGLVPSGVLATACLINSLNSAPYPHCCCTTKLTGSIVSQCLSGI